VTDFFDCIDIPSKLQYRPQTFFYLIHSRCAAGRNLGENNSSFQRLRMVKMHIGLCYFDLRWHTRFQQGYSLPFGHPLFQYCLYFSPLFYLSLVRFVDTHLCFLFNLVLQKRINSSFDFS